MEIYKTIILAIAAYFIGSISFSYIITKKLTGKDIRNMHLKNAGAFNVAISLNPITGIIVGLMDSMKTLIIVLAGKAFGLDPSQIIIAASFAIIGHCFPIYYHFYGGKGAASATGIFIYFIPFEFLISLIPSALIAKKCRDMGLTPVFFIVLSPILAYFFKKPPSILIPIIYIVFLIGIINLLIILLKRDQKLVPE